MAEDIDKKELLSQGTDAAWEKQLADQIRAEIAKKGDQLAKFLALVASFEDDIPNETKRYAAAIKAMTAAAGLQKDDLLAAADRQIEALGEQQNELSTSITERRTELKIKEQKAKDIRKQIDLLTESIKRLEGEEKDLVIAVTSGETEIKAIENKLGDVVKKIEKEILEIKDKINEKFAKVDTAAIPEKVSKEIEEKAEAAISSMIEETGKSTDSPPKQETARQEAETPAEDEEDEGSGTLKSPIEMAEESAPGAKPEGKVKQKTKTCPVCSNPMDWYSVDKNWKCFVCGHEESA